MDGEETWARARLLELLQPQTPAQERTLQWLADRPVDTLMRIISMVEDARHRAVLEAIHAIIDAGGPST